MKSHFVMFAAYNRWANRRLYAAAATVSDVDYRADRGAFFGSLHGTLNHILVADRIWLRRITGSGMAPDRLDAIVCDDLPALTAAREAEDQRIIDVIDRTEEATLRKPLAFRTVAGEPHKQPLGEVLAHVFNHQTHHRGQAHTLLSQIGVSPPPLDLLFYARENQ